MQPLGGSALRARLVDAALRAADPAAAVARAVRWSAGPPPQLTLAPAPGPAPAGVPLPPQPPPPPPVDLSAVTLLAAGKAAGRMVEGLLSGAPLAPQELRLGGGGGLVVTRHGGHLPAATALPPGVAVATAAHPSPDAAGEAAARRALALARAAGPGATVLLLLSGGGSALLPCPAAGLTLGDVQATNALLLASGASIDEVNCVRKHTSAIAGGRLAEAALAGGASAVITLALSDVVGDRADVIASGPTVPDPTTFADALAVAERYGVALPPTVAAHLRAGAAGGAGAPPESPKALAGASHFRVVGSNASALEAVAEELQRTGWRPHVLTSALQGEARETARALAAIAQGVGGSSGGGGGSGGRFAPFVRPCALVFGGETTVTLGGGPLGRGGRNQELVLAFAVAMEGAQAQGGWTCLAFGTDGVDGPTDAAGAFATERTVAAARARGLDARDHLRRHDAYSLFEGLARPDDAEGGEEGGLVRTGPTGTNVVDVTVLLLA